MRKLSETLHFISLPNRRQSRAESTKSGKSGLSGKSTYGYAGFRPASPSLDTPPYTPQVERPFSFAEDENPENLTSAFNAQAAPFSAFVEDDMRLSVVVVGAGFAGLSAAIACARQGYKVTVFERSTGLSRHGDALALGSNATRLLRRWSEPLFQDIQAVSTDGGWWHILDKNGGNLHHEDLRHFSEMYGSPMMQGSRAAYLGMLGTEARMQGVDIQYDTEIVKYLDSRMSPAVVTAAGEHVFCDVIIAADGIHSRAQRQLTRTFATPACTSTEEVSAMDFFKTSYSVHRGMISSESVKRCERTSYLCDGNTRTWIGEDGILSVSSFNRGESLSFTFEREDTAGTASRDWRDRRSVEGLVKYIAGWDPSAVEAVQLFKTCLEWPCSEEMPVNDWISRGGKILMIGDAVHALCPSSYQGGSQAIEDGATIAVCLALSNGDRAGVSRALQAFSRLRRKRTTRAQKVGIEQRNTWHAFARSTRLKKPIPAGVQWLLFPEAYEHDAELDTVEQFEGVVKGFDPLWKPNPTLKASVRAKLLESS